MFIQHVMQGNEKLGNRRTLCHENVLCLVKKTIIWQELDWYAVHYLFFISSCLIVFGEIFLEIFRYKHDQQYKQKFCDIHYDVLFHTQGFLRKISNIFRIPVHFIFVPLFCTMTKSMSTNHTSTRLQFWKKNLTHNLIPITATFPIILQLLDKTLT